MKRWLLALPLVVACVDPEDDSFGEGVAVGNPTKGVTARVVASDDVRNLRGRFAVSALSLLGCDGDDVVVATEFGVVPGGTRVELPVGSYCGVAFDFDAPVELTGKFDDGGRFALVLDVDAIQIDAPEPFDTTDSELLFVFGPTGWLAEAELSDGPSDLVAISPGHERHDEFAAALRDGSALYADLDGDRKPDKEDKVVGRGKGRKKP